MTSLEAPDSDEESSDTSDDRGLHQLDDRLDREELRNRYAILLQELRVALPGVQVLVGFLLTVPFANRFPELDEGGRAAYGIALIASLLSVVCLLTPTVYHRVADRRESPGATPTPTPATPASADFIVSTDRLVRDQLVV